MWRSIFYLSTVLLMTLVSCKKDKNTCVPYIHQIDETQLVADLAVLDQYLADSGIVAIQHESGLRYVIHAEGTGSVVQSCDIVSANYAGYLLNGNCFDTNIEAVAKDEGIFDVNRTYGPFNFYVEQGWVIPGWDIGFLQLKPGAKATLYIPGALGYGKAGTPSGEIPPNASLIFDVEVIGILIID